MLSRDKQMDKELHLVIYDAQSTTALKFVFDKP